MRRHAVPHTTVMAMATSLNAASRCVLCVRLTEARRAMDPLADTSPRLLPSPSSPVAFIVDSSMTSPAAANMALLSPMTKVLDTV